MKTMFKSSPAYLQTEVQKAKQKRLVDELTERLYIDDDQDMDKKDTDKQLPVADLQAQEAQKPTVMKQSHYLKTLNHFSHLVFCELESYVHSS